ncbi:MAG: Gfo/Idh/MocA family oxidoreductase [Desulfovibrionaceae bacterium]|nr:Gfo/Idh/MocA family oxidoreductase [Desulfovibrionaceae bacterium]
MDSYRVAVIGLGVGERHIQGFERHPGCRVTHLCDFSEEKRAAARKAHPEMTVVADAAEVLENPDIDIISVASFDNYHYGQVVAAARAGKHVFVEKPVCMSEAELADIREIFDSNPGLRMSSNLILRMCPRFRELRASIAEGDYGRIYCLEADYSYGRLWKITEDWRARVDDYSVIFGGAIHLVDLALWLTGDRVAEVSGFGTNIATRGTAFRYNDTVLSLLRFESGMVAMIGANFACVMPHFHQLTVYGTEKTFVNGRESGLEYSSRDPNTAPRRIDAPYPGYEKGDLIHSFVRSIAEGGRAEVEAEDVFATMSVCLAMEKAQLTAENVKVKYI